MYAHVSARLVRIIVRIYTQVGGNFGDEGRERVIITPTTL